MKSVLKPFALGASALVVLSGVALAAPAQAKSYQHRHGNLTYSERAAIANSQQRLASLRRQARADGHVSAWERMRVRAAAVRHKALVHRLQHH